MADHFQQYRLYKEAVQLRRFTAADLATAARSSVAVAQKFVNRMDKADAFTKENLAAGTPGRPVILYSLTPAGIRTFAKEISPIIKEINEHASNAVPVATPLPVEEKPAVPAFSKGFRDWIPVFASDLRKASEEGAAGVLIEPGEPAMLRWATEVKPLGGGSVRSSEEIEAVLRDTLTAWQSGQLVSRGWTVGASARLDDAMWGFRVKRAAKGPTVELKRMPTGVPTIEDLFLPPHVGELAKKPTGLVLVTGIGRSGRSRTMAAIVDRVNHTRPHRIITLEEPILYLHRRNQSIVEQRQIAVDVEDFASGLDQALQDSPEVLSVSELSDPETVATTLGAARHSLIFGRVTSASPREAVQKLVSFFPPHEQERVRSSVIANLAGIVALTGVEAASGRDPVAATSVLLVDEEVRAELQNDPLFERINERFEIDTARSHSLRASIEVLHEHGKVSESVVAKYRARTATAGEFVVRNPAPKTVVRG
jgi:twitching motility protein PilT